MEFSGFELNFGCFVFLKVSKLVLGTVVSFAGNSTIVLSEVLSVVGILVDFVDVFATASFFLKFSQVNERQRDGETERQIEREKKKRKNGNGASSGTFIIFSVNCRLILF